MLSTTSTVNLRDIIITLHCISETEILLHNLSPAAPHLPPTYFPPEKFSDFALQLQNESMSILQQPYDNKVLSWPLFCEHKHLSQGFTRVMCSGEKSIPELLSYTKNICDPPLPPDASYKLKHSVTGLYRLNNRPSMSAQRDWNHGRHHAHTSWSSCLWAFHLHRSNLFWISLNYVQTWQI